MVGLFNTNDPEEGWDWEEENFPAKGTGTVTNGSLTANLDGTGSGSYYVVFTAHNSGYLSFVSKEKVSFNGGTVAMNYAGFDLPVTDLPLSRLGTITSGMTLDGLFQIQNRIDANNYEAGKTAMKTLKQTELTQLGKYANSEFLNSTFYKDEACTQPFAGTDTITAATVAYLKKPFTDDRGRMELEGRLRTAFSLRSP
jgi:hypothetical protein